MIEYKGKEQILNNLPLTFFVSIVGVSNYF